MDYSTSQGLWFQVKNGQVVAGPQTGAQPYVDQIEAAANGWFPALPVNQLPQQITPLNISPVYVPGTSTGYDPRYYFQPTTLAVTGDVVTVTYGAVTLLPLESVQASRIQDLQADYEFQLNQPVSFTTSSGATAVFSQGATAINNLQNVINSGAAAWNSAGLNLWMNSSNLPVSPFTFADLQGLASAFGAADIPQYKNLLSRIQQVMTATTADQVVAVNW